MKRNGCFAVIIAFAMLMLALTSCGKSEFTLNAENEKLMTIKVEKAGKGDFALTGSLKVEDGEQIVITSGLTKGVIRVEFIGTPEEQSIDKLPDIDQEPVFSADISNSAETSAEVPAGVYLMKATCLEKATGTIRIEVKPAG